ncbi:MAG: hypothetical protein J5949_07855 [Oscillospiraceae bacterium]|nr:hypothetical protein [Oscillospiraceae bacterium]
MKLHRSMRLLAVLLAVLMLATVAAPMQVAEAAESHTIVPREYTTYMGSTKEEVLTEPTTLYFVDGADDLPYVEISEWAELLYIIHAIMDGDEGYDLTIITADDGKTVTLERENGYSMELDFANDKITFDDYNAFNHNSEDSALLDLVSEKGVDEKGNPLLIMRDKVSSFDRYGDVLEVDLAEYGIPMIAQDGKFYIPMQTMNDFTLLPQLVGFVFNGEALFLASDSIFFDYNESDYTEIAYEYYEAPTGERSDALAEYSYNELCLALDTFYGLKETHDITSFRKLFWEIGFDEALSGNSAIDADNALKDLIDYYLDDLHSVFNEYSALAGLNPITNSTGIANRKLNDHSTVFSEARDRAYPDGWMNYEEVGDTAYITFDTFTSNYYGAAFYQAKEEGKELDDTVALIIYAHEQITRPDSPIKNVVLDLSNNTGGAVDAAVVVLSWFLGDAPFSVKDMSTGALSTAVYRTDINLDHSYDEKDTVADKNLYCLISPVSFSCGNLVPAALKSSQKVTLLGKTSGGGSCVVQPMTTAYGTVFQISSSQRMSFLKNGSFYDIDQGVEPDYYIDHVDNYYDRAALTEFIHGLF